MTLELRDIYLSYSKKIVLDNLSLTFNGGQIFLDQVQVSFNSPKDAIEHGICYVHQTPMLAESISVKENLLLGIKKEYKANIAPVTKEWLSDVNPGTLVKELGGGQRFFVALCSALIKQPRLLILDEPSALLDDEQRTFLFENLRNLADGGMNIIIITHNYDEAENWCDTVDFLENGRLTEKKQLSSLISELKVNSSSKANNLTDTPAPDKNTIVFENLNAKSQNDVPLYNVCITLQKGKITLIQGLAEDGLDTLEKVLLNYKGVLRQKIALIPTDRKYTASNPNLTILQMLTSAMNIPEKQKPATALNMIKNAGVNITPFEKCKNLSGGMLQKLLFERELYNNPELLILCNPLQGLDPETCHKNCERIKKAADNGAYVLVLSYGAFPPQFSDFHYILRNGKLFYHSYIEEAL